MIKRENRPFSEVIMEYAFKKQAGGGVIELPNEAHQQLNGLLPKFWKDMQNIVKLATTYEFKNDELIAKEKIDNIDYYIDRRKLSAPWYILGRTPVGELNFNSPYTDEPVNIKIYFEYDAESTNIGTATLIAEGIHDITLNASQFTNPTTLKSLLIHEIIHTIDPKQQLRKDKGDEGLYAHPGPTEEEGIAYFSSPIEFDARVGELVEMLKGYFRETAKQFGEEETIQQMGEFLNALQTNSYMALVSFFKGTSMFPVNSFLQPFFVYLEKGDDNLRRQVLQKLYRATEEVKQEMSNY